MQFIPPPPSILDLFYDLANKARLEGWDIKIDMNKGKQKHEIHCKPSVIPPSFDLATTQVLGESDAAN